MAAGTPEQPRPKVGLGAKLLLAGVSVCVALGVAEVGLRIAGFQYHLMPTVQFGWPDPKTLKDKYRDDPDLFWVLQDYPQRLRTASQTPADVVFMGDSCTEFGEYPALTLAALSASHAPVTTGVSVGTGGWSSSQGLLQLRRDIVALHPKVVTIYFGWNDHWVALGPTDSEIQKAHSLLAWAEYFRLAQLMVKARFGVATAMSARPNRVSPEQYRSNLEQMVQVARANDIAPVLITAPSNHVRGQEPAYLALRHLRTLPELVPLHQQYLEITRDVARKSGAALCDLAADFDALPQPHGPYFRTDGIHFTAAGDRELARFLAPCIAQAAATQK